MPSKNEITYEARKDFIAKQIDVLLKDKTNKIFTVYQAKQFISERYLFVETRSIDRMLLPYQQPTQKEQLKQVPTNQLELFS
ncbi:hypothetical protein [Tenacibaculum soleae]|uniref:hypothetical protein n=1 Tax=Tenacibaculum soleae TaxID=447689 RepID=UPI0023017480|nr:hypothetical protein [Tenacibaculum soleae]